MCAHELGHLLFGFPDLYDPDGTSEGIGDWCLMSGGSWNGGGDIHRLAVEVDDLLARAADQADGDRPEVQLDDGVALPALSCQPFPAARPYGLKGADALIHLTDALSALNAAARGGE